MTDTRAALEERWLKFFEAAMAKQFISTMSTTSEIVADFVEQECSSLKLLLKMMCAGNVEFRSDSRGWHYVWLVEQLKRFPVELDSSGIPVLTPEILEALKNAAIS